MQSAIFVTHSSGRANLMRLEKQRADENMKSNIQLIRKDRFSYIVPKIGEEENKMRPFKQKIR